MVSTKRIINRINKQTPEIKTPIATDMFLPNQSGDHSAGKVLTTPVNNSDIANKKYVDDKDLWEISGGKLKPKADADIQIGSNKIGHQEGTTVGYLYFNGSTGQVILANTNSVGGDIFLQPKDSDDVVDTTTHKIINVKDPTSNQDASTKKYVDDNTHTQNTDTALGSGCVSADHGTASTDQVINVCYGTGSPPTANTTTEGTLFIKYTA